MPRHRSPPARQAETTQAALDLRQAFGDASRVADRQMPLLSAGEPCRHIIFIVSGWACRERSLADDRRAIIDVYLPGDLIGLDHLFLEQARDRIVALTPVSYRALEREALEPLLRSRPDIVWHLMQCLAEERWRCDRLATRLARLPAIERAAAALLHLHERRTVTRTAGGGKLGVELPLTRPQLADYLGLNEVHLRRALRPLQVSGGIRVQNAAVIVENPLPLRALIRTNVDLV